MLTKIQSYNYNTKNYSKNNYSKVNFNRNINSSPSFTGFRLNPDIDPIKFIFQRSDSKVRGISHHIANLLGMHTMNIAPKIKFVASSRIKFLNDLATVYNAKNWNLSEKLIENPQNIVDIFDMVKKPEQIHHDVIRTSEMPFSMLKKIYESAKTKEQLNFVYNMQKYILDGSKDSGYLIIDMLKSKHSKLYIKSPDDYKSYLTLNKRDKNCIKNLDKLIDNGQYKTETYDFELITQNLQYNKNYKELMLPYNSLIKKKMTVPRSNFIRYLMNDYLNFRKGLSYEDRIDILKMYGSTNSKNIDLRLRLMKKYKNVYAQSETGISNIRSLNNLFEKMDKDKHAAAFIKNVLDDRIKRETIEDLSKILDIVPSKKAEIFHKNIVRIVQYTTPLERERALINEIENPLFPEIKMLEIKYHIDKSEIDYSTSTFSKIKRMVENSFNQRKYQQLSSKIEPETQNIQSEIKEVPIDYIHIPSIAEALEQKIPYQIDDKFIFSLIPKQAPVKQTNVELKRTFKSSSQSNKFKIKSDVKDYIKTKLGAKTFENQQWDYTIGATVMRFKMLPEIFDSISATRKLQRSQGVRPNIENKDALLLYPLIQGRNKKLVKYMLKQTNSENERIFTIKDIVKVVEEADAQILQNKKTNPKYKAVDAKAYYEEIYQNLITQHGKLRRKR